MMRKILYNIEKRQWPYWIKPLLTTRWLTINLSKTTTEDDFSVEGERCFVTGTRYGITVHTHFKGKRWVWASYLEQQPHIIYRLNALSFNGKTVGSDPTNEGSNPSGASIS